MKIYKIALSALAVYFAEPVFSQGIDINYEAQEIQTIKSNTLFVIPVGDKTFDDSLKLAVEKYWKASPFKILSMEEVDEYMKDENNHFITSLNLLGNDGMGTKAKVVSPLTGKATYIFLFHGGKKSKMTHIQYQDALFSRFPFAWANNSVNNGLGYIVKNLNDNVEFLDSKKLIGKNRPSAAWGPMASKEFSKGAEILKDRVLLIDIRSKEFQLDEKALDRYKYPFKFVETSEMISLLNTSPKKYCFLAYVYRGDGMFNIFDPITKSLIYSADTRNFAGQTKIIDKHIDALNIAIGKK